MCSNNFWTRLHFYTDLHLLCFGIVQYCAVLDCITTNLKFSSCLLQLCISLHHVLYVLCSSKVKLRDIFMSFDDVDREVSEFENVYDITDTHTPQPSTVAGRKFAQTASECFNRINRNLRTFLRHNRFPAGELQHLEEELVAFFLEWPSSVYIAQLPDGYRRLMLHAVSQYLDLDARSFDVPGCQKRQTHVENNRGNGDSFSPPPTPLATYIHDKKFACPVLV